MYGTTFGLNRNNLITFLQEKNHTVTYIQFDMQRMEVVYLLTTATVEAKLVFGEYSEHDRKLVDAEDYM